MSQCRPTSKKEDIFLIGFAHHYKIVMDGKTKIRLTPITPTESSKAGLVTSLVVILIVAASPYGASALVLGTASPQVGQKVQPQPAPQRTAASPLQQTAETTAVLSLQMLYLQNCNVLARQIFAGVPLVTLLPVAAQHLLQIAQECGRSPLHTDCGHPLQQTPNAFGAVSPAGSRAIITEL